MIMLMSYDTRSDGQTAAIWSRLDGAGLWTHSSHFLARSFFLITLLNKSILRHWTTENDNRRERRPERRWCSAAEGRHSVLSGYLISCGFEFSKALPQHQSSARSTPVTHESHWSPANRLRPGHNTLPNASPDSWKRLMVWTLRSSTVININEHGLLPSAWGTEPYSGPLYNS